MVGDQHCRTSQNLHPIRFRSQLGEDTAENLVTLYFNCHRETSIVCKQRDGALTSGT